MSTGNPKLSVRELAQLKQALLNLREELNTQLELGRSAADTVVLDQSKVGRLSRMDAMQQQKMAESNMQSTQKRLQKVDIALTKFEQDDFAYCDECGEVIALARLTIRPEANLCITCQSEQEQSL